MESSSEIQNHQSVFVKTYSGYVQLACSKIVFIQAIKKIAIIHTTDMGEILVINSLKKLENKLISKNFIKVNRSYIVNIEFISRIVDARSPTIELKTNKKIKISQRMRKIVFKIVEDY